MVPNKAPGKLWQRWHGCLEARIVGPYDWLSAFELGARCDFGVPELGPNRGPKRESWPPPGQSQGLKARPNLVPTGKNYDDGCRAVDSRAPLRRSCITTASTMVP